MNVLILALNFSFLGKWSVTLNQQFEGLLQIQLDCHPRNATDVGWFPSFNAFIDEFLVLHLDTCKTFSPYILSVIFLLLSTFSSRFPTATLHTHRILASYFAFFCILSIHVITHTWTCTCTNTHMIFNSFLT